MVSHHIGWYCMVFNGIAKTLDGIQWYWLTFCAILWYCNGFTCFSSWRHYIVLYLMSCHCKVLHCGSNGIAWHCTVLNGIAWHCVLLNGIVCYWMECIILNGITLHYMVLDCIAWQIVCYWVVLNGVVWFYMVLHGFSWYCMAFHCIVW